MSFPKFIIMQYGFFADGKASPAYQVGEKVDGELPIYRVANRGLPIENTPQHLDVIRERLAYALQNY